MRASSVRKATAKPTVARSDTTAQTIQAESNGAGQSSSESSGERFDPVANAWSPIASMGTARKSYGTAVIDGLLYAIGGNGGASSTDSLSSGERYDPAANAWSPIASMGTARYALAAVAL